MLHSLQYNKFKSVLLVYSNPLNDKIISSMSKIAIDLYDKNSDCKVNFTNVDEIDFEGIYELSRQNSGKDTQPSNNSADPNQQVRNDSIENLSRLKNRESEKVKKAELILFLFPLIWLSCPSKLKAWFELIFDESLAFNIDKSQFFNSGLLKGKFSMCLCVTDEEQKNFGMSGEYILSVEEMIEHITHGILAFAGITVFSSYIIYSKNNSRIGEIEETLSLQLKGLDKVEVLYN